MSAQDDSAVSDESRSGEGEARVCNMISTGAILLADIIPSMAVKAVVPFLPFYIQ